MLLWTIGGLFLLGVVVLSVLPFTLWDKDTTDFAFELLFLPLIGWVLLWQFLAWLTWKFSADEREEKRRLQAQWEAERKRFDSGGYGSGVQNARSTHRPNPGVNELRGRG